MSAKRIRHEGSQAASDAHVDHVEAHADHERWIKDLERWRSLYGESIQGLAQRLVPELELAAFEDALDRHEAAILTHEELVDRHESRLRRKQTGPDEGAEEVEALHQQMHDRHELSRREHDELASRLQEILMALDRIEPPAG